jgi:hypothetical protein
MAFRLRIKIDLMVLLLVIIAGVILVPKAQAIGDWWHFVGYAPPPVIRQIAEDAGMSEEGKRLFFRFSPIIADDNTLRTHCSGIRHGCIKGRNIYIRQHDVDQRYQTAVVTASHEMLHVVYDRLSKKEKDQLIAHLNVQLSKPASDSIKQKLQSYPPLEYYNEAHSFIGSEAKSLTPELKVHYELYFADRTATTNFYGY